MSFFFVRAYLIGSWLLNLHLNQSIKNLTGLNYKDFSRGIKVKGRVWLWNHRMDGWMDGWTMEWA
jgi:predicted acyl esterase